MTESMNTLEKFARAAMIEGACGYQLPTGERVFCDDNRLPSDARSDCGCKALTRAVLNTLKEPDEEVLGTINETFDPALGETGSNCHITEEAWQAAISHILKESESK